MAGDSADVFIAETAQVKISQPPSVGQIELAALMANAFGDQRTQMHQFNDYLVVTGVSWVQVLAASETDPRGFEQIDSYEVDGTITDSRVFGNHLVIAASKRTDLGDVTRSATIHLLSFNDDGTLNSLDAYSRSSRFSTFSHLDGTLSVAWSNVSITKNADPFNDAIAFFGNSENRGFAVDYIRLEADTSSFADRVTLVSDRPNAYATRQWLITGPGQVVAVHEQRAFVFSAAGGETSVVDFPISDDFSFLVSATVEGDGVRIGALFGPDDQTRTFESRKISFDGQTTDQTVLATGSAAIAASEDAFQSRPIQSGPAGQVAIGLVKQSDAILIRTFASDGAIRTQQLELPFARTGAIPGFVVGDDEIIVLRSDWDGALERDGFLNRDSQLDLYAYLLLRGTDGLFSVSDSIQVEGADFRFQGTTQRNGSIVLRQGEARTVIRSEAGKLHQSSLSVPYWTRVGTFAGMTIGVTGTVEVLEHAVSLTPAVIKASRHDVNSDGRVSPLDALMVINALANRREGEAIDSAMLDYDVNGDQRLSALDALQVINQLALNRKTTASDSEIHDLVFVAIEGSDEDELDLKSNLAETTLF